MKVLLLQTGKTDFQYIKEGSNLYAERLKKVISFEIQTVEIKKNRVSDNLQLKKAEGNALLEKISPSDYVVLLDERGKEFSSVDFSGYIQGKMNAGAKRLVFIIGGAYGFSDEMTARGNEKISLSKMTFSHQIVRLIFLEQLYRAFSIIRGEPYHHE